MKKLILCSLFVFLFSSVSFGANDIYVGDHGTHAGYNSGGSADGSDWNNTYDQLSTAETNASRGDFIYVGDGSYGGVTFNTAVSGKTYITVLKATESVHGTDTGWSTSYGDGQGTFTGALGVRSSYWIIDGARGTFPSKTPSDYGFVVARTNKTLNAYNVDQVITHIRFSHFYGLAPAGDIEKFFFATDNSNEGVHYLTISNCFGDGWSNFQWGTAGYEATDNKNDYWLTEHNVIINGYSSAAQHGEDLNNNYGDNRYWQIRYNWFEHRGSGTATITVLNDNAGPYYIYGNVFYDQTGGDGIIAGVHYRLTGYIYNNTFIDNYSSAPLLGSDTGVSGDFKNNLSYLQSGNFSGGSNPTVAQNAWFSCTNIPSGTDNYITSGNPFINYTNDDFSITEGVASSMTNGTTLTNVTLGEYTTTYNVDAFGNIRGADGVWDRGAIEYGVVAVPANAIQGVTIN